jgi:glycosyltransferase involved in cell wall biosynthesis
MLRSENDRGHTTYVIQYDAGDDYALIRDEEEKWPSWRRNEARRCPAYYKRVYSEWKEAQYIIVNSDWTRNQIIKQGAMPEKIINIAHPMGIHEHVCPSENIAESRKLRVLYVGYVTLRKGVQYLIEAAKSLPNDTFEFTIVGPCHQPITVLESFPRNVKIVGPLPFIDLHHYYKHNDVFVFPTLSDGFGRVQIEAQSYGLPVISTSSCAKVVNNGINGFIVTPGSSEEIASCLLKLHENRGLLKAMSFEARLSALKKDPSSFSEAFGHLGTIDERVVSL